MGLAGLEEVLNKMQQAKSSGFGSGLRTDISPNLAPKKGGWVVDGGWQCRPLLARWQLRNNNIVLGTFTEFRYSGTVPVTTETAGDLAILKFPNTKYMTCMYICTL